MSRRHNPVPRPSSNSDRLEDQEQTFSHMVNLRFSQTHFVDSAAVSDSQHELEHLALDDFVDDSTIADADAELAFSTDQFIGNR